MILNKLYPLPAGHTLTVTVTSGSAHVQQLEDASVAALVTSSQAFGPYALARSFRVQDGGNVSVAIVEAVNAGGMTTPDITYAGVLSPFAVCVPVGVFMNDQLETVAGCWFRLAEPLKIADGADISFNNLVGVDGEFHVEVVDGGTNIGDVSAPLLEIVTDNLDMDSFTTLDLSSLRLVGFGGDPGSSGAFELVSSFATDYASPALERVRGRYTIDSGDTTLAPILTSYTMPSTLVEIAGTDIQVTGKLPAAGAGGLNNVLAFLAGLDGTGGTVLLADKSITVTGHNASPTGAGLTAITTLEGRGCTVEVNPPGAITDTTLNAGGADYAESDTGTIDGGNDDATYTVLTVDGGGAVLTYSIGDAADAASGTGYSTGTNVGTTAGAGIGAGFTIDITRVT